jgi:class 3 adenylate cyclase
LADIYADKGNFDLAFKYANRSLELAKAYGLKEQISEASLKLSELYENANNEDMALDYYKNHITYRDSLRNIEEVQKISNAMNSKTLAELELETQKGKTNRIILFATVGVLFLIGLLAYGLFRRNKFIRATNKIITIERERSDNLLLNILPAETAQELKDKGRVEAKQYPSATVLFSDFVGFTSYAEGLSPEELVKTIDHYFSKFDLIMEKYGLEKIKTIGDAYMAVGGLSFDTVDQAKDMVLAAKDMIAFVALSKDDITTTANFDIRIGINTGPVVAGVVGTKKFAYDIWGDSVNIASRMESNSEAGHINISENTYNIIKDDFDCEFRGELAVKNRGHLKMYFIA